ncbi:hypothetical protein AB3466_14055 [Sphingobacterium thalpophilum]|uniref:hypothetical protein n=1 Tax=Sphingobacterium thalpophilum TaxID=259 RepID=UPI0037DA0D36
MANQFLIKETMADMKNMPVSEISGLQGSSPMYAGIQLLGYYEKGDTPMPIIYYLAETDPGNEDGGSIVQVDNIKVVHKFTSELDVRYFGAIGDGIFDNALVFENIQYFLNSFTARFKLIFPAGLLSFYTSSPFSIRVLVSVYMFSPLLSDSATYALKIGSTGINNVVDLKLNVIRKTQSDWTDNTIGIIITNLNQATNLEIVNANNFQIGLQIEGDGAGVCYNTWNLGNFSNNKVSIKLTQRNAGWVNENLYFGGRFRRITTVNNNNDIYGIIFDSEDHTYENFNNNNFYKPSFEFRGDTFTDNTKEIIPILLNQGQMNKFVDCRDEGNSTSFNPRVFIRTKGTAQKNIVEIGYSTTNPVAQDMGLFPSTNLKSRHASIRLEDRDLVFSVPFIREKFLGYGDTNGRILSSELYVGQSGNPSRVKTMANLVLYNDSILIKSSQGVMVRLDTSNAKRFVVQPKLHNLSPQGCRINIRCYNSSGVLLSNVDGTKVTGIGETKLTYFDVFGGSWRNGSNMNSGAMYFCVSDDVAYIDIIISGGTGTGSTRINGFDIYCLNKGLAPAILSMPQITPCSSDIPTDSFFPLGTFIKNSSGNSLGWEYKKIAGVETWVELPNVVVADIDIKGLVNKAVSSSDTSVPPSTTYSQNEIQGILTELRDLKDKLRSAGILAT